MKIAIKEIIVEEDKRIRKETGDLHSLQSSIEEVGLINPLLIDENKKLIAGFRRLSACRNLGWKEIDVKVIEFNDDPMKMLGVEVAENYFRKDFTPEEIIAAERRRLEIIESQRKKGLFERFWLWLKGLFQSTPTESPAARQKNEDLSVPEDKKVDSKDLRAPVDEKVGSEDDEAPGSEERTQEEAQKIKSVETKRTVEAQSTARSPASKSIFPLHSETLKR